MALRKGKFEIYKSFNYDTNKQWYFRLKSANGKIIAVSEGYSSKQSAIKGAIAVRKTAGEAWIVDEENHPI